MYPNDREFMPEPPWFGEPSGSILECDYTWGFPKIRGTILLGPYNQDCKDYSILGSILGTSYFGKLALTTQSEAHKVPLLLL